MKKLNNISYFAYKSTDKNLNEKEQINQAFETIKKLEKRIALVLLPMRKNNKEKK
ncbi:hypothetical protein AVBRAN12640_07855 [Campylobacter sp. RM12640]|uniref:hypothetical protein n=1 Tax=unclassified Campylobacter TaxID=2593542 RepID=UPI001D2AED71|nr:hypothetical protein [Campylobacter sp. RM12642]MBZ7982448.1 hypothetical protein [Campylobacter sp. RM12640]MBZ8008234.1 hypothetical protein [Campylobacter sp. RM9334]